MDIIMEYLPIFITLAVAQLALTITALVHVLRHQTFRTLNKTAWILIVLLVSTIGPIAYFVVGRGEE